LVKHGAVGCRLSTWRDEAIQREVPCFKEIEAISLGARRLPRSSRLPAFAELINKVMGEALATDRASDDILAEAQATAHRLKIHLA
jgi:multiple sugar transport system substrate-binding protein